MKCEFCGYNTVTNNKCTNPFCTGWHPIATAPKNATEIRVRMWDGTIYERAHYASDLIRSGDSFVEIPGGKYLAEITAAPLRIWEPAVPKEWQPIK